MRRPKSQLAAAALPVPIETIERRIYLIRSQKVMLDSDLADLYQVPTKSLNLAVRRNADRFPEDFMLQLTKEEVSSLRFQFETSNKGRGGRRYLPHAFTKHGVAMQLACRALGKSVILQHEHSGCQRGRGKA